jgi:hypothetical protein
MTSKREIREYATRARQSLRDMAAAMDSGRLQGAIEYAMQASGECGECERLLIERESELNGRHVCARAADGCLRTDFAL